MTAPNKRPPIRPKTGGRKSKLTPELMAQVETALQNHMTVEATCGLLGISRETFYKWIREGEQTPRGLKADFADTVKKAQGMSTLTLINSIGKDPSWQAKAWLLERLHPKQFGRRQLIAHAGADGESDLPVGTAPPAPLTLNITMQRQDEDAPWVHQPEQDEEPTNGTDPWESDHHGFNPTPGDDPLPVDPLPTPPPTETAPPVAPGRGPTLPPRQRRSQEEIQVMISQGWPGVIDTGGKPRDPDDNQ